MRPAPYRETAALSAIPDVAADRRIVPGLAWTSGLARLAERFKEDGDSALLPREDEVAEELS